jgi:hypothetical protein
MSLRRPILTALGLAVLVGGVIGGAIGWATGHLTRPPTRVLDMSAERRSR